MSIEENKAVVGRWFTEFWGPDFNPGVIDELAAPDIRFEYSLHAPCRGRDAVRAEPFDDFPDNVADRCAARLEPAILAVAAANAVFDVVSVVPSDR